MRSAVINEQSLIVENVIVANPAVDNAPNGFILVSIDEESAVTMGWSYDPQTGEFTNPGTE